MGVSKVQQKWDNLKDKRMSCPNCCSYNIHLNRSMCRTLNKYWLECWQCHWCSPRAITINGAIHNWNKYGREK